MPEYKIRLKSDPSVFVTVQANSITELRANIRRNRILLTPRGLEAYVPQDNIGAIWDAKAENLR